MENIFSYGTLQDEAVQIENFNRKLDGAKDSLKGFTLKMIAISNPEVVRISGKTHHPTLVQTDNATDEVQGMVFEITQEELQKADTYEDADYERTGVELASGKKAWVYIQKKN